MININQNTSSDVEVTMEDWVKKNIIQTDADDISKEGVPLEVYWTKMKEDKRWPDEWKGKATRAFYDVLDTLGWGTRRKKGRAKKPILFGLMFKNVASCTMPISESVSESAREKSTIAVGVSPTKNPSKASEYGSINSTFEDTLDQPGQALGKRKINIRSEITPTWNSFNGSLDSTEIAYQQDGSTESVTSTPKTLDSREEQFTVPDISEHANKPTSTMANFNRHFYEKLTTVGLSTEANTWRLKDVKDKLKPKHIKATSAANLESAVNDKFEDYLDIIVPNCPEPSVPEHLHAGYQRATRSARFRAHHINQIRAWLCTLFPPINVDTDSSRYLLPQFCHSEGRKQGQFSCLVCCEYERQTCSKPLHDSKCFEGCKQVIQHGKSTYHKDAINFLRGDATLHSNVKPNMQKQQTLLGFLGKTILPTSLPCLHVRDTAIIESFRDNQIIHKMAHSKVFEMKEEFHCNEHPECVQYSNWKRKHPEEDERLKRLNMAQAELVHINTEMHIDGKMAKVTEAIKSLHPPCEGTAASSSKVGPFAYMCKHCKATHHYLQNLLLKKSKASLVVGERLFAKGMREDALTKTELQEKRHQQKQERFQLISTNKALQRTAGSPGVDLWVQELTRASASDDMKLFIMDCMDLFRRPLNDGNSVQLEVIRNLVGKLRRGRNHHYCDLIKKIAKMHMNFLGQQNYNLMKVKYRYCHFSYSICASRIHHIKR